MTITRVGRVSAFAAVTLLSAVAPVFAQTAPSLGSAESYAVLGGSTVTNTGTSTITGNIGVSPGSSVTGFPPGVVVSGTVHSADASAAGAQAAVTTAFNALGAQPVTQDLSGTNLGGLTLTPGVYVFSSSAQLTGALTLNALGNPAAVFIFRTGSTLTTASGSSVVMIGGGSPCNVYWQIGSSATLGTTTAFAGNILALTSITLNTAATILNGRALARNGAVTLDTNTISARNCSASIAVPALSEWAAILLAVLLAAAGAIALSRRTAA